MVVAIENRAHRRLAGAAAIELDHQQSKAARHQIERIQSQLRRIDEVVLLEKNPHVEAQRTTILELNTQQVSKREIARVMGISRVAVRKVLRSNSTTYGRRE